MDQLEEDEPDAKAWLEREAKSTWTRSYFDYTTKCNAITNNFGEMDYNDLIQAIVLIIKKLETKSTRYCSPYYHVNTFRATYVGWIFPSDNEDEWGKVMPGDEALPLTIERKAGRPRKQRIRGDNEERATSKKEMAPRGGTRGGRVHNVDQQNNFEVDNVQENEGEGNSGARGGTRGGRRGGARGRARGGRNVHENEGETGNVNLDQQQNNFEVGNVQENEVEGNGGARGGKRGGKRNGRGLGWWIGIDEDA
ncbi:hypothetical protein IFM89_011446 [Coptis chinensis]|uniref:Uncharacterized protein n=1 Tax=Coptis chinensis TaxID=261450 RepID=A0A835IWA6_9MAGN|nr:hypothetical protein IFM89_011446 [Coptis chinensis]